MRNVLARTALWVAAFLACGGIGVPARAASAAACPASEPAVLFALPHVRAALAGRQELVIVALGSSSTRGTGASDPSRSYPALLQALLSAGLPDRHVAVLNRGIGGQDAYRELARLEADAIAAQPQLVIWQAGANAALRDMDPEMFRALVATGVRRLLAGGIDVVLMDNQRSPRVLASGNSAQMNAALAAVADLTGVGLFSRDRLMAEWETGGAKLDEFVAPDRLHLNDRGYACTAGALGRDILASLRLTGNVAKR